MTWPRLAATAALSLAALAVLAVPAEALAWGPLAHLNFSAQGIAALPQVQPSVRMLLQEFGNAFLYGSLAADIVVGKNMAKFLYHCHNWKVGFHVLDHARPGEEQAFAWGFLSHLAADTVAHNYYVPFKTVSSFHKTSTKHAYWELRYDQRMDPSLSVLAKQVTTRALRNHDHLLERTLGGASVLPFGFSKQLFRSLIVTARAPRFQHVSRFYLARERKLVLEPDLVAETNQLAVEAIVGLLHEGKRSQAARADATGERNLRLASDLRRKLRERTQRRVILAHDAHEIAQETRESFRRAIHGKLVLPPSLRRLAA